MTKIGLLGCGRLGGIIADALCGGKVPGCRLVGVMGRGTGRAVQLAEKCGCVSCGNIRQLLALEPDYLVEAATAQALRDCALEVLSSGRRLICLSIGAFSDEDFYRQVSQTAQAHRASFAAPSLNTNSPAAPAGALPPWRDSQTGLRAAPGRGSPSPPLT